jgi:hypothetical protein
LKTYLPDGDIDLTALSQHGELKETWAEDVHSALRKAEKDSKAEFRVKEVQYIHAEVSVGYTLVVFTLSPVIHQPDRLSLFLFLMMRRSKSLSAWWRILWLTFLLIRLADCALSVSLRRFAHSKHQRTGSLNSTENCALTNCFSCTHVTRLYSPLVESLMKWNLILPNIALHEMSMIFGLTYNGVGRSTRFWAQESSSNISGP